MTCATHIVMCVVHLCVLLNVHFPATMQCIRLGYGTGGKTFSLPSVLFMHARLAGLYYLVFFFIRRGMSFYTVCIHRMASQWMKMQNMFIFMTSQMYVFLLRCIGTQSLYGWHGLHLHLHNLQKQVSSQTVTSKVRIRIH